MIEYSTKRGRGWSSLIKRPRYRSTLTVLVSGHSKGSQSKTYNLNFLLSQALKTVLFWKFYFGFTLWGTVSSLHVTNFEIDYLIYFIYITVISNIVLVLTLFLYIHIVMYAHWVYTKTLLFIFIMIKISFQGRAWGFWSEQPTWLLTVFVKIHSPF